MKNLVSMIEVVKGCQFANITFVSDSGIPQYVLGKGNKVSCIIRTDCQLNYSYENAVNNRLAKQGDEKNFVAQSLPWGQWVEGQENKLIEHKGSLYLRYYDVANADRGRIWFVNGRYATAEEFQKIMDYLKSKKTDSNRQTEVGLVENQVKPKVVKLVNVLRLAVNGCEWDRLATAPDAESTVAMAFSAQ